MLQDFRYALRQGARQPGLSLIIILTIGLGVGAATTAFSILDTVALQPPSYRNIDRLAAIYAQSRGDGRGRGPAPYDAVRELPSTGLFDAVVAYSPRGFNARAPLAAERVSGAQVSGDLFDLLGATLVAGRPFSAEEHAEGADVVVLGHAFWTRAYQADTSALGTVIHLDGRPYGVIGVAPHGFGFPGASDVWTPLPQPPAAADLRVWAVARLRNGMTVERADAAVARRAPAGIADRDEAAVRVTSLHESLISGKHQTAATALLTASGLVLLIACVNLAGLVLARMSSRRQELAMRAAVGAGRSDIIRLLMTESLVLSAAGGALGMLLAQWGVDLFVGVLGAPAGAAWMDFGVNGRALLFAIGLSVLTAVVFGLAPAVRASRVEIREVLMEGSGQTADRRGGRRQRALVVAQIAVSLALVAAAASVVASSIGLDRVPAGFDPAGVLAARVNLSDAMYDMPAARLAFTDRVRSRLEALPGVTGVTVASHLPLMDRNPRVARFLVDAALPVESQPVASLRFVAADYLDTLRIPTIRGRSFTDVEARDPDGRTALVNQSMARRYWSGGEAVGRTMTLTGGASGDMDLTIVGVVGDVAQRQLPGQGEDQVYLPLAHARDLSLVVRTVANPAHLAPHVRAALLEADAALPVSLQTMADAYSWYVWDRRGQGLVLAALGGVALLLAALGLYGLLSLMVACRQREIGVRLALGSTAPAIGRLIVGASLRLTLAGVACGLLLGAAATAGLATLFDRVRPFDIRVFLFAAGLLAAVALFAAWWPARRAMCVDPMAVLKSDRR